MEIRTSSTTCQETTLLLAVMVLVSVGDGCGGSVSALIYLELSAVDHSMLYMHTPT